MIRDTIEQQCEQQCGVKGGPHLPLNWIPLFKGGDGGMLDPVGGAFEPGDLKPEPVPIPDM